MSLRTHVKRKVGHPITNEPGFDLLFVQADSHEELNNAFESARAKHWEIWLTGSSEFIGKPSCVLYKPSGASAPWHTGELEPDFLANS